MSALRETNKLPEAEKIQIQDEREASSAILSRVVEPEPASKSRRSKRTNDKSKWDRIIAAICISTGAIGLRVVNDTSIWAKLLDGAGASVPLGTILKEAGAVRYKPAGSMIWHDLNTEKQKVSAGDTIFTAADGKAQIQLNDGSSAKILPNSLIVIQSTASAKVARAGGVAAGGSGFWSKLGAATKSAFAISTPEHVSVDIQKGGLSADVKKGGKAVDVEVQGKVYSLQSDSAQGKVDISVDPKNAGSPVRISSTDSNAVRVTETDHHNETVQGSDSSNSKVKNFEIKAGETAVTSTEGPISVKSESARLIYPDDSSTVVASASTESAGTRGNVVFSWEWVGKPDASRTSILVLRGKEDKRLKIQSHEMSRVLPLLEGNYEWQITSKNGAAPETETPWRNFAVVLVTAPRVMGPIEGYSKATGNPKEAIVFSWAPLDSSLRAELEVTPLAKPEQKTLLTGRNTGAQGEFPPGQYAWRARALSDDGVTSDWTPSYRFSIRLDKHMAPDPVLTIETANADAKAASSAGGINGPPASQAGAPIPGAGTATRLQEQGQPGSQAAAPISATGSAAASIPVDSKKVTDPSEPSTDEAQSAVANEAAQKSDNPMIVPETAFSLDANPVKGSTKLTESNSSAPLNVTIQWKPVPGVNEYRLSIKTKSGKTVKEATVFKPRYVFSVDELSETSFVYQVSAKLPAGKVITSEKTPIEIELVAPILKEVVVSGKNNIVLSWERTAVTREYQVQVSSTEAFTQILTDDMTRRNIYIFTSSTKAKYFWRVKGLNSERQSPWSTKGIFELR